MPTTTNPERRTKVQPGLRFWYMIWMTAVPIAPKRHRTRLS
jgi:hypothetical protein